MPKIFSEEGLRFHFYAHEGLPREPVHIHVARAGADAKFWLTPNVLLARNDGLKAQELRLAREIATRRREDLIDAWNTFFAESD